MEDTYVYFHAVSQRGTYMIGRQPLVNMELDLQSLFGLYVHSCTHWLRSRTSLPPPPHPAFGLIYENAIGQPR
jgi:hypothetical protein